MRRNGRDPFMDSTGGLGEFDAAVPTDVRLRHMQLVCADYARNTAELRRFLDMLGLLPDHCRRAAL